MKMRFLLCAVFAGLVPLAIRAQTWTWTGNTTTGNVFNNAADWSPASVPTTNADLIFTGPTGNTNVSFNTLPYTANSLTFSGAYPHYFLNGNGNPLSILAGSDTGITVADTSSGGFGTVD